ncbi:MAG TPA: SDR family NAD(P)-dependent oxidoreductase [Paraburkholderia sp.]|jgi:NAD(P)-dependent dehydrogenase (short-subunit alcohol dehydrogenase family)|nr:SDR family NAD(P)-dependent oxidoreductase [Paraburkholderia sp.]
MAKVWLVTGSARGLGHAIVAAALAAGESVVAGARDPRGLADLTAQYGARLHVVPLDVTDAGAAQRAVQAALDVFGKLDVVVNNAGYGRVAPFEQASSEDFRAQIETNFFGVVNVTRAALPVLRQQRAGHIFQISSVGGRVGNAGLAAYQAAKWAVGGFTEVLSQELAPFGVHVTALEPGGMKTAWGHQAGRAVPRLLADYEPSVGKLMELLRQHIGNETSDPAKVAQLIVRLAYHDALPPHLLLGADAVHYCGAAENVRDEQAQRWREVSLSTGYAADAAQPALPAHP